MSDFFTNLLQRSAAETAGKKKVLTAEDGAIAGQNLLSMLQAAPAAPPATHQRHVSTDSEADQQLKSMLYNGSVPRLMSRTSAASVTSVQIHDMLEGTNRDRSPVRRPPGTVLRGTYGTYEIEDATVMATPSAMTQITKIRNTSKPDAYQRIVGLSGQYIFYAIKPPAGSPAQGGKIRIMNQTTGNRALLSGHQGTIFDISPCPWNPTLLVSLSVDGVAIVWRILDDEMSNVNPDASPTASDFNCQQVCSIKSSREAFKAVDWHPSSPIVSLARGPSVEIWDLTDVITPEDDLDIDEDATPSIPPLFTNNPADPRMACLQGHREAVNSVRFSPDGTMVCSGGDDGAVCIWVWARPDPLQRKFSPDEDRPVNALHWPRAQQFALPSSDRLLYLQCDSRRNIQVWDVEGDTPCARLDLPPGKSKLTLQSMAVDSTASFIIVPFNGDERFGFIMIHVLRRPLPSQADAPSLPASPPSTSSGSESGEPGTLPELDPAGCRFDYLCPFSVQHLILSVAAIGESSGASMKLFAVQSHAVQQFQLSAQQCAPVEAPFSAIVSAPRGSVPRTGSSSSINAMEKTPPPPLVLSSPREPPPPTSSMSPMGEMNRPAIGRPLGPATPIPQRAAKSPAGQHLAAPVKSPSGNHLAAPIKILHRSTSGGDLSAQAHSDGGARSQSRTPSAPAVGIVSVAPVAAAISGDLESMLATHFAKLRADLEKDRRAREKEEIRRTKQLLESVSKTIHSVLPERVEQIVRAEFNDRVVPELVQCILHTVGRTVEQSVLPALENVVGHIVQRHTQDLPSALRPPIQEGFRDCFKEQLLPAFRASFATMFQQINATLETGLQQQREDHTNGMTSKQSFEAMFAILKSIDMKLSDVQQTGAVYAAAGVSAVTIDPKIELSALIEDGELNVAFTKALNAGDSGVVIWLCGRVEPACLHLRGPNEFTPPVLLSLAQQVSFQLVADDNATLKLEWLRESLLALSSRQPMNPQIAAHVPAVLGQIAENMGAHLVSFNVDQQGIARMVSFLITTLTSMADK